MKRNAIMLALLWITASCSPPLLYSETPFDSEKWRNADTNTHARAEMLNSYLVQTDLTSKTRAEVEQTFGQPTETPRFAESDMVYLLGPEQSLDDSVGYEWLVIDLDENELVTQFEIVTD